MAFPLAPHGQLTLNKSTYDFVSVPLSQKNNYLSQCIDQTLGTSKFEFSKLCRWICQIPPERD